MLASRQLIEIYRALRQEVVIRCRNTDINRRFEVLGKAINFLVLADRDLQVLSYPIKNRGAMN